MSLPRMGPFVARKSASDRRVVPCGIWRMGYSCRVLGNSAKNDERPSSALGQSLVFLSRAFWLA